MRSEQQLFDSPEIKKFIADSLAEDLGAGDHSSLACIPADKRGNARILMKQDGVLAGMQLARRILETLDSQASLEVYVEDGVPSSSRHVQVCSEIVSTQVSSLHFNLLQALQDWRMPCLPSPPLPRRQVPRSQGLPGVPCSTMRSLPRTQHSVQGRLSTWACAPYARQHQYVWILNTSASIYFLHDIEYQCPVRLSYN
jgi:hypothetical protein